MGRTRESPGVFQTQQRYNGAEASARLVQIFAFKVFFVETMPAKNFLCA